MEPCLILHLKPWYGHWFIVEGRSGNCRSLNSNVFWWVAVSWTIMPHLLFLKFKNDPLKQFDPMNKRIHKGYKFDVVIILKLVKKEIKTIFF